MSEYTTVESTTVEFTIADLERILRSTAGADEDTDFGGAGGHVPFDDLGYDSLALLELASRVQREYAVPMPDDAPEHMTTPAGAIDYINSRLAERTKAGA